MKLSIVWAPAALQSLDNIVAYLEGHWGQKEANAFLNQSFSIIQKLREYPKMYEESRERKKSA